MRLGLRVADQRPEPARTTTRQSTATITTSSRSTRTTARLVFCNTRRARFGPRVRQEHGDDRHPTRAVQSGWGRAPLGPRPTAQGSGPLTYHGGPVMHTNKTYAIIGSRQVRLRRPTALRSLASARRAARRGHIVTVNGSGYTGIPQSSSTERARRRSCSRQTKLVAQVPAGATTGPISVTNERRHGDERDEFHRQRSRRLLLRHPHRRLHHLRRHLRRLPVARRSRASRRRAVRC